MLQMRKLTRSCLLIVALVLSASVLCYAQTTSNTTAQNSLENHAAPAPQDSDTLKALEIANIRLNAANQTIKLLEERLTAKDATIDAREAEISLRKEQLELAKSAGQDRAGVNAGDARQMEADKKILASCENTLAKAEARIFTLEHPGLLRSIFDTRTATGFFAGFGAGKLSSK